MIILPLYLKINYIVDATHVKKEIKIQEIHIVSSCIFILIYYIAILSKKTICFSLKFKILSIINEILIKTIAVFVK